MKSQNKLESTVKSLVSSVYSSNFGDLIHQCSDLVNQKEDFLLLGLHLCGNLTSDTIREYINNPKVKGVSVVGCCYNQLSESVSKECVQNNKQFQIYCNSLGHNEKGRSLDETIVIDSHKSEGFPMSSLLQNQDFFLARGVRNATSNKNDREIFKELENSTFKRIFFRAILQV